MRPGGKPDFSNVPFRGGLRAAPRDPRDIRELAFSIIRVLNRKGEAVGPWAGLLSDEELLEGLRDMMTVRAFDDRMKLAQRQGKITFYMKCTGEEAIGSARRRRWRPTTCCSRPIASRAS